MCHLTFLVTWPYLVFVSIHKIDLIQESPPYGHKTTEANTMKSFARNLWLLARNLQIISILSGNLWS